MATKKMDNPCWKGYEPIGTKTLKGNRVPNCVPKKDTAASTLTFCVLRLEPRKVLVEGDWQTCTQFIRDFDRDHPEYVDLRIYDARLGREYDSHKPVPTDIVAGATVLTAVKARLSKRLLLKILSTATPNAVVKAEKALVKSLNILSTWFNVTQTTAVANKVQAAVKVLVDLFGYTSHTGSLYRKFYYKVKPTPKQGDVVEIQTGLRSVQSWSGKQAATARFAGNEYPALTVELLSSEKELLNTRWLRKVLAKLLVISTAHKLTGLKSAVKDVNATLRPSRSSDDEDEVIMMIPGLAKVRVVSLVPAYQR